MRLAPCSPFLAGLAIPLILNPLNAQDSESTSVGGYGEVHYTNATGANTPGMVNVRRFVLYLAHTFNEKVAVRSELELGFPP